MRWSSWFSVTGYWFPDWKAAAQGAYRDRLFDWPPERRRSATRIVRAHYGRIPGALGLPSLHPPTRPIGQFGFVGSARSRPGPVAPSGGIAAPQPRSNSPDTGWDDARRVFVDCLRSRSRATSLSSTAANSAFAGRAMQPGRTSLAALQRRSELPKRPLLQQGCQHPSCLHEPTRRGSRPGAESRLKLTANSSQGPDLAAVKLFTADQGSRARSNIAASMLFL